MEPNGRMSKERECNEGEEVRNLKERNRRDGMGWIENRYVKKRKERTKVIRASGTYGLASGAAAERQPGRGPASGNANGGGLAREAWTGQDQGVVLSGRVSKERERKEGDEEKNRKERTGRGEVGWIENDSISLKGSAGVYIRENREKEVRGNVVYWEVKGG